MHYYSDIRLVRLQGYYKTMTTGKACKTDTDRIFFEKSSKNMQDACKQMHSIHATEYSGEIIYQSKYAIKY